MVPCIEWRLLCHTSLASASVFATHTTQTHTHTLYRCKMIIKMKSDSLAHEWLVCVACTPACLALGQWMNNSLENGKPNLTAIEQWRTEYISGKSFGKRHMWSVARAHESRTWAAAAASIRLLDVGFLSGLPSKRQTHAQLTPRMWQRHTHLSSPK